MDIVVVGAGAMGSLFGALLSSVASVSLLDPWEDHVSEINEHGLGLSGESGERTIWLPATSDPSALPSADLAIVFVKSSKTAWAAEVAASILKPDGLVITLQNGLGNSDILEARVGPERTAAGVTSHGATLLGPGRVRHAGKGPTHLGFYQENEDRVRRVADVFSRAGLEVHVSDSVRSLIWGKLITNAGINALTAILRVRNGVLVEVEPMRDLMDAAVREAAQVAAAKGIQLPYEDPVSYVRAVATRTGQNLSSMLQDTLRSAPTEIDVINGAIAREGAALGIATPVNSLLRDLVKALEAGYGYCVSE
jgi:2-dehydropantoate 2-reductase